MERNIGLIEPETMPESMYNRLVVWCRDENLKER